MKKTGILVDIFFTNLKNFNSTLNNSTSLLSVVNLPKINFCT